jgi:hypothetical protein
MPLRFSALLALALLAGCTWEGRPDGAEPVHTASDGYYDDQGAPQTTPLGAGAETIEPLDDDVTAPLGPAPGPPVELTQPPPTTGTDDATSEVEEALTPGTEQ